MVELFLVRHGETQENLDGILQGHLPGRLTANGVRQAETLRRELAGERFDVLLVSDLARTVATARVLNEAFGLPLVTTSLLRERDWGSLTLAVRRSRPMWRESRPWLSVRGRSSALSAGTTTAAACLLSATASSTAAYSRS